VNVERPARPGMVDDPDKTRALDFDVDVEAHGNFALRQRQRRDETRREVKRE